MPEYGLKIKNESGGVQIDSTYINYVLHEHDEGIFTVPDATPPYNNGYNIVVTFSTPTTQPPLIAIRPVSANYFGLKRYIKSGENYTGFEIVSDRVSGAGEFDWQSFIPQTVKSSDTFGLRIYNGSDVLVYDAGYKIMRIIDTNTANPDSGSVVTITHTSYTNAYYIIFPHGYINLIQDQGMGHIDVRFLAMIKSISATEASFGGRAYFLNAPAPGYPGSYGYWPSLWTILTVKKAF